MSEEKSEKTSANQGVRSASLGLMEPMLLPAETTSRSELMDLVLDLTKASSGFARSLPHAVAAELAALVRSMNCYYSNLIEGHNTHPIDIERALAEDFSDDPHKRDLQKEARAHIEAQRWIDGGGLAGRATSIEGLCETHRRFCALLPDELLWVENPQTGARARVVPGAFRESDVIVGRHLAIEPDAVPRFMARFAEAYSRLGPSETVLAAAAAHHRFLWIHPFSDGNGRVARLMSHAMLLEALDTQGLWSVARGLARQVVAYKGHLAGCDAGRRNDLDGRGSLSQEELIAFTRFFLGVCRDQVAFMEGLVEPNRLRARVIAWADHRRRMGALPAGAPRLLEALLYRGEMRRGDVAELLGVSPRTASTVIAKLAALGAIGSGSAKGPIRIVFSAALASEWMPGLFPET